MSFEAWSSYDQKGLVKYDNDVMDQLTYPFIKVPPGKLKKSSWGVDNVKFMLPHITTSMYDRNSLKFRTMMNQKLAAYAEPRMSEFSVTSDKPFVAMPVGAATNMGFGARPEALFLPVNLNSSVRQHLHYGLFKFSIGRTAKLFSSFSKKGAIPIARISNSGLPLVTTDINEKRKSIQRIIDEWDEVYPLLKEEDWYELADKYDIVSAYLDGKREQVDTISVEKAGDEYKFTPKVRPALMPDGTTIDASKSIEDPEYGGKVFRSRIRRVLGLGLQMNFVLRTVLTPMLKGMITVFHNALHLSEGDDIANLMTKHRVHSVVALDLSMADTGMDDGYLMSAVNNLSVTDEFKRLLDITLHSPIIFRSNASKLYKDYCAYGDIRDPSSNLGKVAYGMPSGHGGVAHFNKFVYCGYIRAFLTIIMGYPKDDEIFWISFWNWGESIKPFDHGDDMMLCMPDQATNDKFRKGILELVGDPENSPCQKVTFEADGFVGKLFYRIDDYKHEATCVHDPIWDWMGNLCTAPEKRFANETSVPLEQIQYAVKYKKGPSLIKDAYGFFIAGPGAHVKRAVKKLVSKVYNALGKVGEALADPDSELNPNKDDRKGGKSGN